MKGEIGMELNSSREKIEEFLSKNKRKLDYMESLFSIDDNRDHYEKFTEDRLKVLCVFLTPASSRAVSNTFNALMSLVKKEDPENIVVDSCYYPEEANLEIFDENKIPYIFGSACHEPIEFYDLVLMSNAVCPEVLNIPKALHKSGIGLTIEERNKQNIPLIVFGGAAANETSIVLGPIYRDGKCIGKSLIDISEYGYGEKTLHILGKTLLEYKRGGMNLHDKEKVKERFRQEKVLIEYLYYPDKYDWVYDEDKFTIKEIKKLDDRLPDKVKYARIRINEDMGWSTKVFNLSGDNADSHDIMISSGCSGGSSNCSFCMEATVAGGYREKPLDEVEQLMKETRKICAPNTISYYSYNLNYYYRFMDLLATGAKYFSGVTLLNERLDVVAHAPEQLKLAKKLGLKRFSGAIEGMGPRIRDGLLNKNLDKETLEQANHVIASLGLMHFKAGLIATGQETDEDIDSFVEEIDRMIAIRDEHGANHSFQFNVTPLVFYSQIALRHFPRITAENSFNQVRNMGRFIDACKERGIRAKFNGKGCGTWLEQLLLDFGPAGTDWMVGLTIDQGLGYIRFFGDKIKEAAVTELTKRGYEPLFFTKARPKDWIFPNDHVDSIPQELKDMWWQRTEAWRNGDNSAFDSKLCLRTPANLEGAKCYGCKMCESAEEIKNMVKREIYDEHTYDQVAEMLSDSRHQKSVRVVAKMKSQWSFYNRTSLAHYITSKFLQASEEICDNFFSVGKTTTTWIANNGQKAWVGGTFCFDINLRERVSISEFNSVIDKINSQLESCQILRVIDDTKTVPVRRETNISYIGQTSAYSMSQIKDKISMFDWDIKVAVKSMGGGLDTELKHMPELKTKVLFVQKGNSVLIGMDLPASISPYFVMNSIMGKSYEKALDDFSFDVIDQTKDTDTVDSKGQHIGYSYFTGDYNKRSNIETIRLYLAKLSGKI